MEQSSASSVLLHPPKSQDMEHSTASSRQKHSPNRSSLWKVVAVVSVCFFAMSTSDAQLKELQTTGVMTTTTSSKQETQQGASPRLTELSNSSNTSDDVFARWIGSHPQDNNYVACHNESMDDTVPAFVIAGAQKGGTSALYAILKQHPNLLSSRKFEAHFFDRGPRIMQDLAMAAFQYHLQTIQNIHHAAAVPAKQHNVTTHLKDRLRHPGNSSQGFPNDVICNIRQSYVSSIFSTQKEADHNKHNVMAQFEKTPFYICKPEIPILMQLIVPWTKILIVLRNPVDRAYSQFKMCRERHANSCDALFDVHVDRDMSDLREHRPSPYSMDQIPTLQEYRRLKTFNSSQKPIMDDPFNFSIPPIPFQVSKYHRKGMIRRGFYAEQLIPWLRYYRLNVNLKVISYDSLNQNKQQAMDDILDFLQLPRHNFTTQALEQHYNVPGTRQQKTTFEPIDPIAKDYLQKLYAPHNRQLEYLLGPEWKGIWEEQYYTVNQYQQKNDQEQTFNITL